MRVWRIAHETLTEDGFPRGPYRLSGLDEWQREQLDGMSWDHTDDYHQSPYGDARLRRIAGHERCGFDSVYALYAWFGERWRAPLFAAGFKVYEYDVPDDFARVGEYGQTLFSASAAQPVGTTDLEDMESEYGF